jgi:thiol-disulfide isomerase/thioredoxin
MWSLLLAAALVMQDGQRDLLVVTGESCIPCKSQKPIVEHLMRDGVRVFCIDIEKDRDIATAWRVQVVPTLIVLDGNREVTRFTGLTSQDKLLAALRPHGTIDRETAKREELLKWWFAQQLDSAPSDGINPTSVSELALACHVRIRAANDRERNWGSGTIFNSTNRASEVITNKHVLGNYRELAISIDDGTNYWQGAQCQEVWPKGREPGSKAAGDDVGVVLVNRTAPTSAILCELGYEPVAPLYVVGSPRGQPPVVRAVNGFRRWRSDDGGNHFSLPTSTASGESGGGVYDSRGILVGVVWGSTPEDTAAVDLTRSNTITANTRAVSKKTGTLNAR